MSAGGDDSADLTQLVDEYRRLAAEWSEAAVGTSNVAADLLADIHQEIRSHGKEGADALIALLSDGDRAVRSWAAAHCLDLDSELAAKVLAELTEGPKDLVSFSAAMTLRQWRLGDL